MTHDLQKRAHQFAESLNDSEKNKIIAEAIYQLVEDEVWLFDDGDDGDATRLRWSTIGEAVVEN